MGSGVRSGWWRRLIVLPTGVATALVWLGTVFLFSKPLGFTDWYWYASATLVAVGLGFWTRRAYRAVILERSERGLVLWWRPSKFAGPPPEIVRVAPSSTAAADTPAPPAGPPVEAPETSSYAVRAGISRPVILEPKPKPFHPPPPAVPPAPRVLQGTRADAARLPRRWGWGRRLLVVGGWFVPFFTLAAVPTRIGGPLYLLYLVVTLVALLTFWSRSRRRRKRTLLDPAGLAEAQDVRNWT